jgi:H+-translocating NAD(P) transhydrogenase subunit alpha
MPKTDDRSGTPTVDRRVELASRSVTESVITDTQTTIGVVAESGADERRVALVPKAAAALVNSGLAVVVEAGAGEAALLPDDLYTEAGATVGDAWAADVVVKVAPPTAEGVGKLRSGQTLIGFLAPRNANNQIEALTKAGVQALAVEAIPRISRAQVMDALSSQANVAGYKAVLVAALESTRFFPMLTTAAGPKVVRLIQTCIPEVFPWER